MTMTSHAFKAHEHVTGIWCDECPDAEARRIEQVLHNHDYVEHNTCRCGWVNPLDGTQMAHRKHVAAIIAAHVAEAVTKALAPIRAELERSFAQSAVKADPHAAHREAVDYVRQSILAVMPASAQGPHRD